MTSRTDETRHRLADWTQGQSVSERLAAHVIRHEGFTDVDPSHPYGGPDGGVDATCKKNGLSWAMAAYFPRRLQRFAALKSKFASDLAKVRVRNVEGMVFVTNQELLLRQRDVLHSLASPLSVELIALDRIASILDEPGMSSIRRQFLGIGDGVPGISLGGHGGSAPGAGGGGGGAWGTNALGGAGGLGGEISINGTPGTAPGAGGGGAGAVGEHAVGGEGGAGGELITEVLDLVALQALDPDGALCYQVEVGAGGRDGGEGGDTKFSVLASDGRILKSVVAKGGCAGKPGFDRESIELSDVDIDEGWRVSSLFVCDQVYVRDGLLYAMAAGFVFLKAPTVPFDFGCTLACAVEFPNESEAVGARSFVLQVVNPTGQATASYPFVVRPDGSRSVGRAWFCGLASLVGSELGVWSFGVLSGKRELIWTSVEVAPPC